MDIAARLASDYPDNTKYQRNLAIGTGRVASARESLGDATADDFWRRAHEVYVALDAEGRLDDGDREVFDELTGKLQGAGSVSDEQAAHLPELPNDIADPPHMGQVNTDGGSRARRADATTQVSLTALSVPLTPTSVAVDTAGNTYVTIDRPIKRRVLTFAAGADTPTELPFVGLVTPCGVAVDHYGSVYVADSHTKQILKLTDGVVTSLPFTDLKKPSGLAVDDAGNVYVADAGDKRVLRLAQNSNRLTTLPFADLEKPSHVAVDNIGDV